MVIKQKLSAAECSWSGDLVEWIILSLDCFAARLDFSKALKAFDEVVGKGGKPVDALIKTGRVLYGLDAKLSKIEEGWVTQNLGEEPQEILHTWAWSGKVSNILKSDKVADIFNMAMVETKGKVEKCMRDLATNTNGLDEAAPCLKI